MTGPNSVPTPTNAQAVSGRLRRAGWKLVYPDGRREGTSVQQFGGDVRVKVSWNEPISRLEPLRGMTEYVDDLVSVLKDLGYVTEVKHVDPLIALISVLGSEDTTDRVRRRRQRIRARMKETGETYMQAAYQVDGEATAEPCSECRGARSHKMDCSIGRAE